jgi:hypothetical protein
MAQQTLFSAHLNGLPSGQSTEHNMLAFSALGSLPWLQVQLPPTESASSHPARSSTSSFLASDQEFESDFLHMLGKYCKDEFLTQSSPSSSPELTQDKIRRPLNCFMAYRKVMQKRLKETHKGMNNKQVSVIIGKMWANEPQSTKDQFKKLADECKRQHAIKYPGYKYRPKRKMSVKKGGMAKQGALELPRSLEHMGQLLSDMSNASVSPQPNTARRHSFSAVSQPSQVAKFVATPMTDMDLHLSALSSETQPMNYKDFELNPTHSLANFPPTSYFNPSEPAFPPQFFPQLFSAPMEDLNGNPALFDPSFFSSSHSAHTSVETTLSPCFEDYVNLEHMLNNHC